MNGYDMLQEYGKAAENVREAASSMQRSAEIAAERIGFLEGELQKAQRANREWRGYAYSKRCEDTGEHCRYCDPSGDVDYLLDADVPISCPDDFGGAEWVHQKAWLDYGARGWKVEVDGDFAFSFPALHCPMCGRRLP